MNIHKAGFVNIIGNPNVGKSTLMNELVGEKLSIITDKAQTTRHRIMGIVNGEDFQVIYSDTPGALKPHYKMQEGMMQFVNTALSDADIILYVVEMGEKPNPENSILYDKLQKTNTPLLLLINKIDLGSKEELDEKVELWQQAFPKAVIVPVSVLQKFNLKTVFDLILKYLPENPPFYDKTQLTDKPEKFFVSEIVREKILKFYQKEIPYSVEVIVNDFKEEETIIKISAEIMVARESQKGIIIGHLGKAIKKMGTEARKDIERFFKKKVFIELFVKVNKDWRDNETQLKKYGYIK
jgi:GTP-binding protein Era